MNAAFWARAHGGATHFPLALIVCSVAADGVAWGLAGRAWARELHTAGYWLMQLGAVGAVLAVLTGLVMTRGSTLGSGAVRAHHLFVWPAFALSIALATWRVLVREGVPRPIFAVYLIVGCVAGLLVLTAGYTGGELLLGG